MNKYPESVKNTLFTVIESMTKHVQDFVRNPSKDFVRQRTFSFQTVIKLILSMGSNTLATEILKFFSYKNIPTVSAFVQQRQKILPEAFHHILKEFNTKMNVPPKLFHGYQVIAIDGSVLTIPYNPKEPENIRTQDHCNYLHLNTLYDVCSKRYIDAVICPGTKTGEKNASIDLLANLPEMYPILLLADRGYEYYNLFAHVEERDFDYLIRIKDTESTGMLSSIEFPKTEEFDITRRIVITRHSTGPAAVNPKVYKYFTKAARFDFIPNSKSPDYELIIRFVRFKLADGKYVALATSLDETKVSTQMLKELYHMRWGIETSYRDTKWVLGMVSVHSKKAANIMQEVYAHLIMYNFSMYICVDLKPDTRERKNPVKVNITQAIKICIDYFKLPANAPPFPVEATILRFVLPVRQGRSYPRVIASPSTISFNYRLA